MLATGYPAEEAEISVLSGQVDVSMTAIGLGSINRGSIYAMSKSREEAGVSVPYGVSDSVDGDLRWYIPWSFSDEDRKKIRGTFLHINTFRNTLQNKERGLIFHVVVVEIPSKKSFNYP